jgi:hypothetical protein
MLIEQTALSNAALSNTSMTLDIADQLGTGVPEQDQIMLLSITHIDTQKHSVDTVGSKSIAMFCSFRLFAVWHFMEWKLYFTL